MVAAENRKKGRILRAIWNGPFYIGPLSSPASVGDVLLKVLETAWRALVAVVSLVLVGAAIVACWLLVIEPTFFPPLKSSIEASVRYDDGTGPPPIRVAPAGQGRAFDDKPFRCTRDFPLVVRFTNQSKDTIGKISFEITAYRQGYAEPVSSYTPFLESSAIIEPGYWLESCWSGPAVPDSLDAQDLIYRVEIFSAEKVDPALANRLAPNVPAPSPPAYPVVSREKERGWAGKIGVFVASMIVFAAFFVSAACLVAVVEKVASAKVRKWIENTGGFAIIIAGVCNFLLLAGIGELLSSFPTTGEWLVQIDRWSRASGYADAAMVGLFAVASLWTLPALWFVEARFGHPDALSD